MPTITGTTPDLKLKERQLTIKTGLLGFEKLRQFVLKAYEVNTPFYWLLSEEQENVSFIVMEPKYIVEDYVFDITEDDVKELKVQAAEDIFVLVILCIPEDVSKMTANLLGPLVFNKNTNIGKQIVLQPSNYPVQFPLFPDGIPAGEGK